MIHTYQYFTVSAHCFFSLHTVKSICLCDIEILHVSMCRTICELLHVCRCDKQPYPFFISDKARKGEVPHKPSR